MSSHDVDCRIREIALRELIEEEARNSRLSGKPRGFWSDGVCIRVDGDSDVRALAKQAAGEVHVHPGLRKLVGP